VIIVAIDVLVFAVPLTALAAACVIVARPHGFLEWVRRLYGVASGPEEAAFDPEAWNRTQSTVATSRVLVRG